ncbi:MAG: sensor histidine kinase [Salibacteraceae bacterium]
MDLPEELEFAWLMLIGISLTFLLALAVVVFFVYYQRRLFTQNLAMEQLKLEEQQKRMEAVMAAQENERSRIARDLHDEVGVMLSTAKLYLTLPDTKVQDGVFSDPGKIQALLDGAVTKLRAIARNLSPEHLEKFGLEKAIEDTFRYIDAVGDYETSVEVHLHERLSLDLEVQLYRIVQELVNNTLKHAKATQIKLLLRHHPDGWELQYTDNGIGFDVGALQKQPSLGLTTLSGRVAVMKGKLTWTTPKTGGTQANILFPPVHHSPPKHVKT